MQKCPGLRLRRSWALAAEKGTSIQETVLQLMRAFCFPGARRESSLIIPGTGIICQTAATVEVSA